MNKINNVAIVGMGALGLMFGDQIRKYAKNETITFVMDEERLKKHSEDKYIINGDTVHFEMKDYKSAGVADLVILSVKYSGLESAIKEMKSLVGEKTIIISLMNGISSEEMLAEVYDRKNILGCVAIGMDAMRKGTELVYEHMGKLQFGALECGQDIIVEELDDFFERVSIPHEMVTDIKRAIWNKFMINVGINQACMVYSTDYQHATEPGPIYEEMARAMHEVIDVAKTRKINLTENDFLSNIEIIKGLSPTGYPSMRQDAIAKRPSEVELFAGTMIKIGRENNIAVPVNAKYYSKIKEIESEY